MEIRANLIAGAYVANPAGTGEPRVVTARGQLLAVEEATDALINQALAAAANAAEPYRHATPEARAAFLERIGEEIMALGDQLLEAAHTETALPIAARLAGERARTVNQLKMFAELIREGSWVEARIDLAQPVRQPLPKPDLRRMLIPLGPVAVFAASNFPLAFSTAGGDTASALAAGCPVIVKAHRAHPGQVRPDRRAGRGAGRAARARPSAGQP